MTTVFFVRHAEPNRKIGDDASHPLSEKGLKDCALVSEFLRGKKIDAVLSSPFKRAVDTVKGFADEMGLPVILIEDFRERKISDDTEIDDFKSYFQNQWNDFSFKLKNGECLSEVQGRNIRALETVLKEYAGKNIVIGTHGTALSAIINYFDSSYGLDNFKSMMWIMPWVVKIEFDNFSPCGCVGMEKIDLFKPQHVPDYENCKVRTAPLGALKSYKYNVVFARYKDKWLYGRHKERDSFETAGGRVENGETILESAKRELYEETGALKFDIVPAFDYSVHLPCRFANGRVFLAHIQELGEMPDFEMKEIALFNMMPPVMRFPKILPALFGRLQGWLNEQYAKDEILDVYDENKRLTGRTKRRGDPMTPGDYRLVVFIWLLNSKGELLITKRAPTKGYPHIWENTGGSAITGDDSLSAAIREVKEETGLTVNPENGKIIFTRKGDNVFFDTWLFKQDFDLKDVVLQQGETIDAKYATPDEIESMIKNDEFFRCDYIEELRGIIEKEFAKN